LLVTVVTGHFLFVLIYLGPFVGSYIGREGVLRESKGTEAEFNCMQCIWMILWKELRDRSLH